MLDKRLMKHLEHPKKTLFLTGVRATALALFAVLQAVCLAWVVDRVFLGKVPLQELTAPLALLGLAFVVRPVLGGYQEHRARLTAVQVKGAIREALARAARSDYGYGVQRHGTGTLSTLAVEGVEGVDAYFSEFVPQLVLAVVTLAVVLPTVLLLDPVSALVMGVTAPLIPGFMILIGKTADGVHRQQWDRLNRMNGHLLEVLRGMVTLCWFGRNRSQEGAVAAMSEGFRNATMKVLRISFLSAFTLELLATLSTAVVAVSLGLRLLYGRMDFFPALTVLLLAPELYQPLRQLGLRFHASLNGKVVAAELEQVLEATAPEPERTFDRAEGLWPQPSLTIRAEGLCFAYRDAPENPVLKDIALELPPGRSLAVIGDSGIGKTTFLKLLLGAFDGYGGSLTLGGVELRNLAPEQVASVVSYVPQRPAVFTGTVLENLLFGLPEDQRQGARERAEAYAARSGFDRVVARLQDGYETHLGDGGSALSGGEAQLMGITRAWLRETPIVLLDEPTSAMDVHLEGEIIQALQRMKTEKTLVIAAHRPRTTAVCDRCLRLGGAP